MQQRIEQHRAVAVGHDEAVAVGPLRLDGLWPQMAVQHLRDVPCPSACRDDPIRLLHRVHGERADGVRKFETRAHEILEGEVRENADYTARWRAHPDANRTERRSRREPWLPSSVFTASVRRVASLLIRPPRTLIPSCFNLR